MKQSFQIPDTVAGVAQKLSDAGFRVYLVGGCVRNILMKCKPKDWDLATNAKPEQVQKLFEDSVYENAFGTVLVKTESEDPTLKTIEVTTFRIEGKYTDKRRPEGITFAKTIEEDLSRRDFAMNAIALSFPDLNIIDPFEGQVDLKKKIIRAVGNPHERFSEDALRLMRAVRLATELGFTIEEKTAVAVKQEARGLESIAAERIRDEFIRIINSENPRHGLELMREYGILELLIPELLEGIGVKQNQAHAYEVWEHNLRCLAHGAKRGFSFHVKLAALLHDVAKPHTKGWNPVKKDSTFYGHDVVGARMTKKILERLKVSRETVEIVTKLVRYHLFFSDPEKITMSAVRRLVRNVGREHIWELMNL